jgi:hypothetical protein
MLSHRLIVVGVFYITISKPVAKQKSIQEREEEREREKEFDLKGVYVVA